MSKSAQRHAKQQQSGKTQWAGYLSNEARASLDLMAQDMGLTQAQVIERAIEMLYKQKLEQGVVAPTAKQAEVTSVSAATTEPMSVSEAIAKVLMSDFSLDVSRADAAFVCGIHAHMGITRQPALEVEELERIFEMVAEASLAATGEAGGPPRAQAAIQRLKKQGLLERVDAKGLASFGQYTLSSLALKLRDDIFEREALNRRSLRILLKRIIADLSPISVAARKGGDQTHWNEQVVDGLRYLVADVVRSIIARQKGLDAEQTEIRKKIGELLKMDSFKESTRICEELLDTTSNTLEELHKILMEEMGAVLALLNDIVDSAYRHQQSEAANEASSLQQHVESISTWSENFQKVWAEYYSRVQNYIRFNLQVDPNRKLVQRLRDSIKKYDRFPWTFKVFAKEPLWIFNEDSELPHGRRLAKITVKEKKQTPDANGDIAELKKQVVFVARRELETRGRLVLTEFIEPYTQSLEDDELFTVVGTLHWWLMRYAVLTPKDSTEWVNVRGSIDIQDIIATGLLKGDLFEKVSSKQGEKHE
jgi:chromosome condensin MukBEF complex kleisin-like MukF subunit